MSYFTVAGSHLRAVWLILTALFFYLPSTAQLLDHQPATVWLSQSDSMYADSTVLTPGCYIGNHPVLPLSEEAALEQLNRIASQSSGTLFMVLKTRSAHLPDEQLLQLGRVVVHPTKAYLDGKELPLDTIGTEATLLRFNFQGRLDNRHRLARVAISKHVQIAELIFYDKILTKEPARIVESYLAMKYSVNITQNTDPELRDYLDIFKTKAWNARLDQLYDEEVLALGRLDRISFFQSQTYTSDARSLCVSLDSTATLGKKPLIDIDDESLLILSRKNQKLQDPDCGGSALIHGWKLKLINWNSEAKNLYLTLDTLLDSNQHALLTNGELRVTIPARSMNGQTRLSIPLDQLETREDLYLAWNATSQECEPLAEAELLDCGLSDSSSNRLYIQVQPEALPAALSLVNLKTGETLHTQLDAPLSLIDRMQRGQYELNVFQENQMLLDEIFTLGACLDTDDFGDPYPLATDEAYRNGNGGANGSGTEQTTPWVLSTLPGNGPATLDKSSLEAYLRSLGIDPANPSPADEEGISVFPNPASRQEVVHFRLNGFAGTPFSVQVFDSQGNLMKQQHFTAAEHISHFEQRFRVDGSYFIRFSSAQYSETKHVRIKSNLH